MWPSLTGLEWSNVSTWLKIQLPCRTVDGGVKLVEEVKHWGVSRCMLLPLEYTKNLFRNETGKTWSWQCGCSYIHLVNFYFCVYIYLFFLLNPSFVNSDYIIVTPNPFYTCSRLDVWLQNSEIILIRKRFMNTVQCTLFDYVIVLNILCCDFWNSCIDLYGLQFSFAFLSVLQTTKLQFFLLCLAMTLIMTLKSVLYETPRNQWSVNKSVNKSITILTYNISKDKCVHIHVQYNQSIFVPFVCLFLFVPSVWLLSSTKSNILPFLCSAVSIFTVFPLSFAAVHNSILSHFYFFCFFYFSFLLFLYLNFLFPSRFLSLIMLYSFLFVFVFVSFISSFHQSLDLHFLLFFCSIACNTDVFIPLLVFCSFCHVHSFPPELS